MQWNKAERPGAHRTLQFASLCFDASFFEIFTTLNTGGSIYLIPEATRSDPLALGEFIRANAIEEVTLPIVLLHAIAHLFHGDGNHLPSLGHVIATGEALSLNADVVAFVRAAPGRVLDNYYGPSETHVVTAYTLTAAQIADAATLPPIGRPIQNCQMFILDAALNPVPLGVAGALYIAGTGLGRGYLGRPDLTAERFLPNPHGEPGSRMYLSGDMARYRADGQIEFLGRADDQVKIRGFRIELGEIEGALAALPNVREVVVLAREDQPGDRRLVAYLVAQDGTPGAVPMLRAALSRSLPDYMVPAHFVWIDAVPLTSNGKVDRKRLPRPDLQVLAGDYVAPATASETAVAALWAHVLGVERVGLHDNFFELGGHSLLATQVRSAIRAQLGVELPLRALFEHPTLAPLCRHIDELLLHVPLPGQDRGNLEEIAF